MTVGWLRRGVACLGALAMCCMAVAMGCGDDADGGPQVTLRVTRDFGRELLAAEQLPLEDHETALRLLRASHRVKTADLGYVVAIDDLRQSFPNETESGQSTAWAMNLNGIETDLGASDFALADGDVVQFDLRDIQVEYDVRATVGAFPETFTGGIVGRRFPTSVRCARGYDAACREVRAALRAAGVDPSGGPVAQSPPTRAVRRARESQSTVERAVVLVGPWSAWRGREVLQSIDVGPRFSGVFARFSGEGSALSLLDWDGGAVRSAGAGTGLVAASRPTEADLVWLVTGVDRPGVERAARAFERDPLRDAFAVAVTADGVEKLPLPVRHDVAGEAMGENAVPFPGRLLVRAVKDEDPPADGRLSEIESHVSSRPLPGPACSRFHASPAGPSLCTRVSRDGFGHELLVLDGARRTVARRGLDGVPSRVRVSRDGRYGAYTVFTGGQRGYFASTSAFSTATRIVDMSRGATLLRLEDLDVRRRGGGRVALENGELWGVTFAPGGRYYATLAPAASSERLLIAGRVGRRRAIVVGSGVECPSLSPDGSRIAYKRRLGSGSNRWRLHVRDLRSGRDVALAEPRSIDDQPEWLGDGLVAYSDGKDVYAVRADGQGGEPSMIATRATSPSWLPGPVGEPR